nr:DUF4240 domain-containing protein [uncultured Oscillibacter sp.]
MDPDAFWDLIAGAKRECGQDMDASLQWLTERLTTLGPQQAQDFHDILHGYKHLAYKYGLWTAATMMCGDGCSDDGFMDFRAWLIAQGKEVYLAALADPDSLADVEPYGGCQFESFSYVASKVLNTLTGRGAYVALADFDALVLELSKGIQYGEGIDYPYEWDELERHFPRLCGKYLEPETVEFMLDHGETIWFPDNEDIKEARAAGPPRQSASQVNIRMEGM